MGRRPMGREEALRLINTRKWYHRFEILPGIATPGQFEFDASLLLDLAGVSKDLRGLKALDIGTWDGALAFELEKRGATVTAVDIQDPDRTAFNVAKQVLDSRVEYVRASVYDLPEVVKDKQDLICFKGVYYHLKYPMLGFEKISAVLVQDGLMYFEGECLLNYAETLSGKPVDIDVTSLGKSEVPLAIMAPGRWKDGDSWFIPNLACLGSVLGSCGMQILRHEFLCFPERKPPMQRVYGLAKKVAPFSERPEHPIF